MINLIKGTTVNVYFTGKELAVIASPYYLFVFTNRVTGEEVKIMATDTSNTARVQKFSLTVNNYFSTSTTGTFIYNIVEKADDTDMTVSGNIVESGYMFLNPATAFAPTEYTEQSNTFVTYGE